MRASLRILGAIAIVLSLTLTGCTGLIQQVVKDQTGVGVNTDDGTAEVDTEDGNVQLGGVEFPADFPSDVPVPNGTLVGSLMVDGTWGLTYQGVAKAEMERLIGVLEAAGYTKQGEMNQAGIIETSYQNDKWTVTLLWNSGDTGDDANILVYAVAKASS